MAGAAADTLRLEGFGESIKGGRVAFVLPSLQARGTEQLLRARLAALDSEVAHRGRKILVTQGTTPRWLLSLGWDATFHVRDVADLKLALTHMQHATRPARVVWFGAEPQTAVMSAITKMDGLTFAAILDRAPATSATEPWQAIFWAPDAAQEGVEAAIGARMGSSAVGGQLRAVLKELRSSNVGLVWSTIGESDRRGSLYWYDPQEGGDVQPAVDFAEAAETLRRVADVLVAKANNTPF